MLTWLFLFLASKNQCVRQTDRGQTDRTLFYVAYSYLHVQNKRKDKKLECPLQNCWLGQNVPRKWNPRSDTGHVHLFYLYKWERYFVFEAVIIIGAFFSFTVIKATGLCGKEKNGMRIDIYFLSSYYNQASPWAPTTSKNRCLVHVVLAVLAILEIIHDTKCK